MNDVEKWQPIKGYEGYYEVSSFGRVKAVTRKIYAHDRFMNPCVEVKKERELLLDSNRQGYKRVTLSKNGTRDRRAVHRLVAEAFLSNPEDKSQVNHIDGDPSNNNVKNLEWNTPKENQWHSRNILKNDSNVTKKRPVLCVDTGEVFPSIREAQRVYGKNTHIWEAASGRRKKAANKKWNFIKEG